MTECQTHKQPFVLHHVDLRLERPGEEALFIDAVLVHACPVPGCFYIRPTEDSRRRLLQTLGIHPENEPPEGFRVSVADWRHNRQPEEAP